MSQESYKFIKREVVYFSVCLKFSIIKCCRKKSRNLHTLYEKTYRQQNVNVVVLNTFLQNEGSDI